MKDFDLKTLKRIPLMILLVGFAIFTACNDDEPEPEPDTCTFELEPECFCGKAENVTNASCVTFLKDKACSTYDKSTMYIRWRNESDAGIFSWEKMTPVTGSPNVYIISQPASRFYLPNALVPNFGAQLLEFSNQPDYGGLNNSQPWQLYRNQRNSPDPTKDWVFATPVDGKTSKKAYYVSVSTRNTAGEETVVCPPPADVTNSGGFRLNFQNAANEYIFDEFATITYTIDASTGEVAVGIEKGDACTSFDKSVSYIRWRNESDAGIFTWEKMAAVAGQQNVFQISQLAENFFTADGTTANWGAQILEFSNQSGYGQDSKNSKPVSLFRNDRNNNGWLFSAPVNGVTSKKAGFVEVISIDAAGVESAICPPPAGVNKGGFRLNDVQTLLSRNSKLSYTLDAKTGEVALAITEEDPCTTYDQSKMYIRWRNESDAGIFSWAEMAAVEGSPGVFRISQPAANFYLAGADVPNFGAQVFEFSNQSGYGQDLKNGRRLTQLRTNGSNRDITLTNGAGTLPIVKRKTFTVDSNGVETTICEESGTNSLRFVFNPGGTYVISKTNTIEYSVDINSGLIAVVVK